LFIISKYLLLDFWFLFECLFVGRGGHRSWCLIVKMSWSSLAHYPGVHRVQGQGEVGEQRVHGRLPDPKAPYHELGWGATVATHCPWPIDPGAPQEQAQE
jgi:hypothetical protein